MAIGQATGPMRRLRCADDLFLGYELMLSRVRCWRERGWTPINAADYADAWRRFGGSVATHPQVVERLAGLAGIPVRYLGWLENGEVQAALPTWGRHLALSKDVLKRAGKKGLFDLGNAEIILPIAEGARMALYAFEAEATAFVGENGQTAARLEGEYDILLTNRLILQPTAEMNFYGKNDPERGVGSGLANTELGLRLRYEIVRQFAPYIGVSWSRSYGNTADMVRDEGGDVDEARFVAGIRMWF